MSCRLITMTTFAMCMQSFNEVKFQIKEGVDTTPLPPSCEESGWKVSPEREGEIDKVCNKARNEHEQTNRDNHNTHSRKKHTQ